MTSVGTPSSAGTTPLPLAPLEELGAVEPSVEEEELLCAGTSALVTTEPVRDSSSELRLNSCHHRAQTRCAPTPALLHPSDRNRVWRGPSSKQPRPRVGAGAEHILRKARASTNTLARVFGDANATLF